MAETARQVPAKNSTRNASYVSLDGTRQWHEVARKTRSDRHSNVRADGVGHTRRVEQTWVRGGGKHRTRAPNLEHGRANKRRSRTPKEQAEMAS